MKYKFTLVMLLFLAARLSAETANDTVNFFLPRAYTELVSESMYSLTQWIIGDCITDNSEAGGENGNDLPDYQQMMLFNVNPCNSYLERYWFRAYNIIFHCNKVLDCLTRTTFTVAEKKQIAAEAKFVRSLAYFELTRIFGGVPIITSDDKNWLSRSQSYSENNDYVTSYVFKVERSSIYAVYNFIETELKASIPDLPGKTTIVEKRYKATKGAGNALLAKVYLYESSFAKNYPGDSRFTGLTQKWADALSYAELVINSGEYSLIGTSGDKYITHWDNSYLYKGNTTGFRYIFSEEGNYSNESIFEAEKLNKLDGWLSFSNNGLCMYTMCRYYMDPSRNMLGWGFNKPTDDLINAYKKETGNAKDDPRYKVTIGTPEDSVFLNHFLSGSYWRKMDFSNTNLFSVCRKFEVPSIGLSNGWHSSPINVRVIRYADVILMAAEAALETGNTAKALTYINLVRARARNCGNTGHPLDLTAVTHADIELERRLELALEGHRFFDLVRWNKAESTLNGRINKTFNKAVVFTKGVNEFFPLPSAAMINSPLLVQNNGYEDYCAFLNKPNDRNISISVKSFYVSMKNQYSGNSKFGAVLTVSSTVPSYANVSFKNDTIWFDLKNSSGDSTFIKLHLAYSGKTKDTSFLVKSYRPITLDNKALHLYKAFSWACFAQTDTVLAKYGVNSTYTAIQPYTDDGLPFNSIWTSMVFNSKLNNSLMKLTFYKSDFGKYFETNGLKDSINVMLLIRGSNKNSKPIAFATKFKLTDIIQIGKYPIVEVTANKDFTLPISISYIDTNTYTMGNTVEYPKDTICRDHKVNEVDIFFKYDKNKYDYVGCTFENTILSSAKNISSKLITEKDSSKTIQIKFDGPLFGEGKLANLTFKPKISEKSSIIINNIGFRKNYTYYNKDSMRYVSASDAGWTSLMLNYLVNPVDNINNELQNNSELSVYPNPAKDFIMLNLHRTATISIFDMYGRIVLQSSVMAEQPINVNTIKSGMYIIQVTTENKTFKSKFLKK